VKIFDQDPLAFIEQMKLDQQQLYNNQQQLNQNIKLLVSRVNEQQQSIDSLIKGLEMANKTTELMMTQLMGQLQKNYADFSSTGQH
jgi:ABC-type transporter Mla subunit MlaD